MTFHSLRTWLVSKLPTEGQLRGSRLHKLVGQRLFAPELWKLSRPGVIGGATVGAFISMTPTFGVQVILAALAAIATRKNIPVTIVATGISNPLTAAFIYTMEYRLGRWILGAPGAADPRMNGNWMQRFISFAEPLSAGSLVFGLATALLVYLGLSLAWKDAPVAET